MKKILFLLILIIFLVACKEEAKEVEKAPDNCGVAINDKGCWVGPISINNSVNGSYVELEGDNRRIYFTPYATVSEAPSCREAANLVGMNIKKCKWINRESAESE